MPDEQQLLVYVLAGAVPAVSVLLGLLLGLRGRKQLRTQIDELRDEVTRSEAQARDHSRMVAKMQGEQGTVATLALSLPTVVRELNRGDLEPRAVPPLILNLADAVFQPGYMLLYTSRPNSGDPTGRMMLQLVAHQGYGDIPDSLKAIPFEKGKIGWVASHRLDMLKDDWVNLSRTEGTTVEDNHPTARLDIAGPLVHHHVTGEQVLGVLCIGNPGTRPRNDKLMFQLVTNLGSLALVKKLVRPADRCCRYGGEEFIVAMPDTDSAAGMIVAERVRAAIENFVFDNEDKQPGGKMTISGGVSSFPADGTSVLELTKHADVALYDSKRAGRNRVARFKGIQIGEVDEEPILEMSSSEVLGDGF